MRARPEPSDAGASGRCASRALHPRALLAVLVAAVALLAPAAGALLRATPAQAARPQALAATAQPVVLADDEGLRLVGPVAALGDKPAPELDDLSRTEAAGLADLPRANVFFRGAICRRPWRFRVAGAAHLHPAQGDLRAHQPSPLPLPGRTLGAASQASRGRRRQHHGHGDDRAPRPLRDLPHTRVARRASGRLPARRVHPRLHTDDRPLPRHCWRAEPRAIPP